MKPISELLTGSLRQVDTTTGINGYPRYIRIAYTADTMAELRKLKDDAEANGYLVTVLDLHRRDGWSLWERRNGGWDLSDERWMDSDEDKLIINLNNESDLLKDVFDVVVGQKYELNSVEELFDLTNRVKRLSEQLPDPFKLEDEECFKVFLMNDNIDYVVRTGQNGYSYDTHNYCTALLIEDLT